MIFYRLLLDNSVNVTISPVPNTMINFVQDQIMDHANVDFVFVNQDGRVMRVNAQNPRKIALMLQLTRLVQAMDIVNVTSVNALNLKILQFNIMDLNVNLSTLVC